MKHFTKLILFSFLLVLAACQNESVEETIQQEEIQGAELRFKNNEVVSDGLLEKDELLFNENSENLVTSSDNFLNKSADGCTPDLLDTGFNTTVNIEVVAKPGANAYFDIAIDGGDVIPAFCSDRLPSLNEDDDFIDFTVVSSYDPTILPGGAFENVYANPQNFDKVNWILNNIEYGPGEQYTYGHVQYAIWRLIENPFVNDFPDFLTPNPGDWDRNIDEPLGDEIVDAANANGQGYTPGCGDKLGLLLIPEDFENVQALLITKHLPEEEECDDCIGKVDHITFKWNWHNDHRVRLYQRFEHTRYAVKIFDGVVGQHDEISVNGANHNGTFGKWIYVFVGHCYYTKFRTDCHLNIGPGYKRGVLEVVSGTSTHGGELCEYEPPHHWCWWW
ncbi:hypothetical protein [Winogradskyella sp.]|uniref:hypothetical protein n=1 Tax=Winogradskyella sp. TaxID=1883156 RepID=UPI0026239284|nr:hypothetical protein [Winogradskyella sp.]